MIFDSDYISNTHTNFSDVQSKQRPELIEHFKFPMWVKILCYLLYNLTSIVGLTGNIIVFYIIAISKKQKVKTVPNYFLANLALGDILISGLSIPFGYISLLWQHWPFGNFLCYTVNPTKAVAVFVSSYTLIAIAWDRYRAILHPLKVRLNVTQSMVINGLVWISAFITIIPLALTLEVVTHEESGLPLCGEYGWKDKGTHQLVYNLALVVLQYFFPVSVLTYTYTKIYFVVCKNNGETQDNIEVSTNRKIQEFPHPSPKGQRKSKTLLISLAVVLSYSIAWLPYNVLHILTTHSTSVSENSFFPYIYLSCHWLSMAHSTFNPVIYFWMHSKLRNTFFELLSQSSFLVFRIFGRKLVSKFMLESTASGTRGSATRSTGTFRDSIFMMTGRHFGSRTVSLTEKETNRESLTKKSKVTKEITGENNKN